MRNATSLVQDLNSYMGPLIMCNHVSDLFVHSTFLPVGLVALKHAEKYFRQIWIVVLSLCLYVQVRLIFASFLDT